MYKQRRVDVLLTLSAKITCIHHVIIECPTQQQHGGETTHEAKHTR